MLDAPAFHPDEQDRQHRPEVPAAVHRRIREIKLAEIELADVIVTVSELARRSYLAAGVAAEKVISVPLGVDRERFGTVDRSGRAGPLRIAFVGAATETKGFDVLVAALTALAAEGISFQLRRIGPRGEHWALLETLPKDRWSDAGSIPQRELPAELASCDLLVLPSRGDSFGMVVPEALATGLPCVISDQVGSAPLVTEGETGWIVPAGEVAPLAELLKELASEPERARHLAPTCRKRSREATWASYNERFVEALAPWLAEEPR